ncbi:hypothetical protein FQA39_LY00670 [Lamprigera yunnana]|nr:hypothetical protein FQA39_LY00670 [Lamprigera yunnana]
MKYPDMTKSGHDIKAIAGDYHGEKLGETSSTYGNIDVKDEEDEFSSTLPPEFPVIPIVPSNEDYEGPLNFDVSIKSQPGNSNLVYSEQLNKLFTVMSFHIPVDFKWQVTSQNMYVRATPLYSNPQHAQQPVLRCLPHSLPSDQSNKDIPKELHNYVLRCQNLHSMYYGCIERKTHMNVLVPLWQPQTGTDFVRVMYSFACKNSCPSGMNRKPIEVVFTLEDEQSNIYGRKKIAVRICSCPKRDKDKEEKDSTKTPVSRGQKFTAGGKKLFTFNDTLLDTKEYNININICGKHNQYRLARTAYEIITTQLAEHGTNEALKANQEHLYAYLMPNGSIIPMRKILDQLDGFAKVWEKAHKNQSKNDIYKIRKEAFYEIKEE